MLRSCACIAKKTQPSLRFKRHPRLKWTVVLWSVHFSSTAAYAVYLQCICSLLSAYTTATLKLYCLYTSLRSGMLLVYVIMYMQLCGHRFCNVWDFLTSLMITIWCVICWHFVINSGWCFITKKFNWCWWSSSWSSFWSKFWASGSRSSLYL